MDISEVASAIYNDVIGGLRGYGATPNMSIEQLEDEVVEERQVVIKEWFYKGLLNRRDLMLAINCIEVDCKDPAKCCGFELSEGQMHFEIPPLVNDLGNNAIEYIGSVDRMSNWFVYFSNAFRFHQYKKRGADSPYVYIEPTPNENGMYDGWIFNAPFVKNITVIGIFRDPRLLQMYNCCSESHYLNLGSLSNEVKKRLTEKKLRYYRQFAAVPHNNDQIPR